MTNLSNLRRLFTVLIVTLMLSACGGEKITLLSGLDEINANQVVAALIEQGIDAEKVLFEETYSVSIFKKDMAQSVSLLNAKGLPNRNHKSLGEIFKKEGMISSPLEERARYIYGLSQELESTFSKIDHVIVARVHIVLAERIAPGQPVQPASAAVFIKHTKALDPDTVEKKIRRIVAASVPSLAKDQANKITISFVESENNGQKVEFKRVKGIVIKNDSVGELNKLFIIGYVIIGFATLLTGLLIFGFIKFRKIKQSLKSTEDELSSFKEMQQTGSEAEAG